MSSSAVRRYTVKTYGRGYAKGKEGKSTRAFDELLGKPAGTKAVATKWGRTSFSRVRDDPEAKKRKTSEDPFSFDSDEDGSPRKAQQTAMEMMPPPTQIPAKPVTRSVLSENKPNTRTNSKAKKQQQRPQPPRPESPPSVMKPPAKTYTRNANRQLSNNDVKQLRIDQFMMPVAEIENQESVAEVNVSEETSLPSLVKGPFEDSDDELESTENQEESVKEEEEELNESDPTDELLNFAPSLLPASHDNSDFMTPGDMPEGLSFRSSYLKPEVYKNFVRSPGKRDNVGKLMHSTVANKRELKHDGGTTLIVVCSPKGIDQKTPGVATKYFKDSRKDIFRSNRTGSTEVNQNLVFEFEEPDEYNEQNEEYTVQINEQDEEVQEDVPNETCEPQSESVENSEVSTGASDQQMEEEELEGEIKEEEQEEGEEISEKRETRSQTSGASVSRFNRIFRSRNKDFTVEPLQLPDHAEVRNETREMPVLTREVPEEWEVQDDVNQNQEDNLTDSQPQEDEHEETLKQIETAMEQITDSPSVSEGREEPMEEDGESQPTKSKEQRVKFMWVEGENVAGSEGEMESSQESPLSSQESPLSSQESDPSLKKKETRRELSREKKIFKSKNSRVSDKQKKIFQSPKKSPSKAVYNVRSWQADIEDEEQGTVRAKNRNEPPKLKPVNKNVPVVDEGKRPNTPPTLMRAVHWPDRPHDEAYTSLHVNKEHKELYTVVKNVKEAHECQEFGETQEFDDDIEYLLSGLQDSEPMSTRCLSCVGLAQKCIMPAFRMHLRAHGTITKIFGSVQDACSDPSLAICTAALMYMLSRDRLNMDLDSQSLDLMLKLLGVDNEENPTISVSPSATRALNRNRDRIRDVCNQLEKEGSTKIELDSISTGNLAMECLLSLTSRRAGEWFKEELRSQGALEHIVDTVCSCVEAVGDDTLLTDSAIENLKRIDRCLRVLENVTFVNEDNQTYLISYKSAALVSSICRALRMCENFLAVYPLEETGVDKVDKESTGWIIYCCVLAVLRVLLNVTHENEYGCTKVGEQKGLVDTVLICVLQTPQYVPTEYRFDMLVLSLGLLTNLAECCEVNRRRLILAEAPAPYESNSKAKFILATRALVEVFCQREEAASQLEAQYLEDPVTPDNSPNKSGEWKESDSGIEWVMPSTGKKKNKEEQASTSKAAGPQTKGEDLDDETFTKVLHKAGKHMENSIIAAYVGLLLGCVIQNNSEYVKQVQNHLPNGSFEPMIHMLKKFLGFMNLTAAVGGTAGGKSIARVIEELEAC